MHAAMIVFLSLQGRLYRRGQQMELLLHILKALRADQCHSFDTLNEPSRAGFDSE